MEAKNVVPWISVTDKRSIGTFEPLGIVKGQIARIMLYMIMRYMGNDMESTKNVHIDTLGLCNRNAIS